MTHTCHYGNCPKYGTAEEMITVSGGGFRQKYCSWIHAALGCLHHTYARNFKTYWSEIVQRTEKLLEEADKHKDADDPTKNIMPKSGS